MRRAPFFIVLGLAASCDAGHSDPVLTSINAGFTAPRGLLDGAEQLVLRVIEGGLCKEATGIVDNKNGVEIANKTLTSAGCDANAKFCGDLSIAKSATPRVFEAKALGPTGTVVAVGCTTTTIDRDTASIAIKMVRYLEPAVCGDGKLQPTEQCEPGGTSVCDAECQSTEVLLSTGAASNGTSNGDAGDKTDPFFLWPQATGDAGRFIAFYTDRAAANVEIGMRVMNADLAPATTPPAAAAGSLFLPNGSPFPPAPVAREQSIPSAALFGGKYYVAFRDDTGGANGFDVRVRAMPTPFQADMLLAINGGTGGEPGTQTAPAISAGAARLLVVWEDQSSGAIVGRTLTPPSTLGSQNQISTGTGNSRPAIAPTERGWVVVWSSDTGVKLRVLDDSGTPSGAEEVLSDGGSEGGAIASLSDGRFAVVWSENGDIFLQRFDTRGIRAAGDAAQPLNDVVQTDAQTAPAIASTPGAGGSYVVAWHDGSTGHVRARAVGGSTGFLFNHVNGQTSEFQASVVDGRVRTAPVVVSGGSAPFVAIGWADQSPAGSGIVARRFPLPE